MKEGRKTKRKKSKYVKSKEAKNMKKKIKRKRITEAFTCFYILAMTWEMTVKRTVVHKHIKINFFSLVF